MTFSYQNLIRINFAECLLLLVQNHMYSHQQHKTLSQK